MNHFQQTLVLAASPAAVYAALTTPAGLRGWWTEDCDVAVEPGREVRWLCVGAHIAAGQLARRDEWIGTRLVFRIAAEGAGRTRLEFEHLGLVPEFECYGMCSSGWRHYMASLARFVETGVGTPHRLPATALAA
jgi:hypothetical protein